MVLETHPTRAYRVSLSDRKNRRTVQATSSESALSKAVGVRHVSAQRVRVCVTWAVEVFDVVMQSGKTVRAYVESL